MTYKRMALTSVDINKLVDSIRDGDKDASCKLIELFKPMIQKVCHTLYTRLRKTIPMLELLNDANNMTLYLVAMEYKKDTELGFIAHLPRFLQTTLPARMVQYYRPLSVYRGNADQLFDDMRIPATAHPLQALIEEDISTIIKELNNYMWDNFNEQELDIIINSVIKDETKASVARRYKVSKIRIQYIYNECIRKLFRFMKKNRIHEMNDII